MKNEWLKMLAVPLTKVLTSIFNEILRKNEIPTRWEMSEIIILHKKGNKNKLENYRPITLNSNICKVFMKVLKNRIYNKLDQNQTTDQAGFRRNFSTLDHILTLNQIIEKKKRI